MPLFHVRSRTLGLLAAAVLLLGGAVTMLVRSCGGPPVTQWPPEWSFPAPSPVVSTLAIQNAVVYAASADATLHALSLATGELVWQRPLAMPSTAAPVVKYGLVLIGSNEPAFHAFDALSGAEVWKVTASGAVSQPAAFAKGRAFFSDDSGVITGVDAITGKVLWRFQGEGAMSGLSATSEGLFVATSRLLYCLEGATGKLRWSLQRGSEGLCSPTTDGKVVLVGGGDGRLLACRGGDGSVVWSARIGEEVEMLAWVQGEKVFVAAGSRLVCLWKRDGLVLWKRDLKERITTPPGGQGRGIFVATERGNLYVLDTGTGRRLWKRRVGGIISGRINFHSGSLFFGTWGGEVRALRLPAGR